MCTPGACMYSFHLPCRKVKAPGGRRRRPLTGPPPRSFMPLHKLHISLGITFCIYIMAVKDPASGPGA